MHFAVVFLLIAISAALVVAVMAQSPMMILPVIGAVALFVFKFGVGTAEETDPDFWYEDNWRR